MASANTASQPGTPHIRIQFEGCSLDREQDALILVIEAAKRLIGAVGEVADDLDQWGLGNGMFDVTVIDEEGDPVHFEPE